MAYILAWQKPRTFREKHVSVGFAEFGTGTRVFASLGEELPAIQIFSFLKLSREKLEENFSSDQKMKEGFCQGQRFAAPLGGSILCSPVKSTSGT